MLVIMSELNFHSGNTPPQRILPPRLIPIVLRLKDAYKTWQEYLIHFPKQNRYTLGTKIDGVFLTSIEYCFLASYAPKDNKITLLDRTISRIDLLKLLLQLAWETKALDSKKYTHLSTQIDEIGRMTGGWKRGLLSKTPALK